ncbi:MAG: ComEC/Rec2 family competence protein [Mycobacteriales bacterium]
MAAESTSPAARLVPAAAGAWAVAVVGTAAPAAVSGWAAASSALLAGLLRGRRGLLAMVAGFALGVAVAGPSVAWHVHRLRVGPVVGLAARHSSVEAVVKLVRDPVPVGAGGASLFIVDATAFDRPVLVLARGDVWRGLLPGQRVRVRARVSLPRPNDDVAAVLCPLSAPLLVGRAAWWQRAAGRARVSLRGACAGLPSDERGLLPSLVDGDTAGVPPALRDDMRVTGLSHLEAVSGENLSIVLAVVLAGLRGIGLRRRLRVAGAAVAVAGFVVLARPSPSVQRAAVMSGVMLLAMFTGRRTAARSALAVAVLALVVLDPFLARSIGFVLSVCATAGIVALAPAWTRRLESRVPRPLALAIAVSAAAQLACTPVLVLTFGQLTPYAVPANLVAGPAVVPATVLGVTAAIVAPMSSTLAHPLVWLAGIPTGVVARVAHLFAAFPGAATTVGRTAAVLVAAAATLLLWRAASRAAVGVPREILLGWRAQPSWSVRRACSSTGRWPAGSPRSAPTRRSMRSQAVSSPRI